MTSYDIALMPTLTTEKPASIEDVVADTKSGEKKTAILKAIEQSGGRYTPIILGQMAELPHDVIREINTYVNDAYNRKDPRLSADNWSAYMEWVGSRVHKHATQASSARVQPAFAYR